jgi:hypothetical protein
LRRCLGLWFGLGNYWFISPLRVFARDSCRLPSRLSPWSFFRNFLGGRGFFRFRLGVRLGLGLGASEWNGLAWRELNWTGDYYRSGGGYGRGLIFLPYRVAKFF